MLINFLAGNQPHSILFLPGVEKPPQRLAKEERLALGFWSLRSPTCKMGDGFTTLEMTKLQM